MPTPSRRNKNINHVRLCYCFFACFAMSSFEFVFFVLYYSGLHPFYYDKAKFSFVQSKSGQILKLIWGMVLLLSFFVHLWNSLNERDQVEVSSDSIQYGDFILTKWNAFLKYWLFVQFFFSIYCLYFVSRQKLVQILTNYLISFVRYVDEPRLPLLLTLTYVCELFVEILLMLYNAVVMFRIFKTTLYIPAALGLVIHHLSFLTVEITVLSMMCVSRDNLARIKKELPSSNVFQGYTLNLTRNNTKDFPTVIRFFKHELKTRVHNLRIRHYESTTKVEILIDTYKIPLLYTIADLYVSFISYSYYAAYRIHRFLQYLDYLDYGNVHTVLISALCAAIRLVRLFQLCQCHSLLDEQIKSIRYVLDKLTISVVNSDVIEEIKLFQHQCDIKDMKVSLADLFNLDGYFLHSALGAALAYIVLLVQFSNDKEHR